MYSHVGVSIGLLQFVALVQQLLVNCSAADWDVGRGVGTCWGMGGRDGLAGAVCCTRTGACLLTGLLLAGAVARPDWYGAVPCVPELFAGFVAPLPPCLWPGGLDYNA